MQSLKKLITIMIIGFIALAVTACNDSEYTEPTGENVGSFGSYESLKEYLLLNYETQDTRYYSVGGDMMPGAMEDATDGVTVTTDQASEPDYSKTNNQVDGVEEADKILTDGYKIYIASGSKFLIVDADTLEIDFTYEIENGSLNNLYLYGDRVVLMTYEYNYYETSDCSYYEDGGYVVYPSADAEGDISTEVDATTSVITTEDSDNDYISTDYCIRYVYNYGTGIRIFDVSDSEDVTLERELYFDSSYIMDTRMIDENLYLIINNYMIQYGFYENDFVPKYEDSAVSNELIDLPANHIYYMPNDNISYGYLVLVSLDVTNDNEAANVRAYLGSTYRIFMSENNLYTTTYRWSYLEEEDRSETSTLITRFEIINDELVYKAVGKVAGSPLNQFSMDEYDGVFRIATTGYSYDSESFSIDNFLFQLDATSEDVMNQISVMDNLGKPGERIYAVRYSQDIAYVVTFVQTDPLYKLDLSDPENPVILGELYEDGVSDYLHQINDNLMIGIGREAVTNGEWTNFTGVKVALYDTSGDTPVNLDTYLVPGEYSYTNVMWDHKAFMSFTPQGADFTYVAIPVYEYYEYYSGFSQSIYLFKVTFDGELSLVSRLSHLGDDTENSYPYFDTIERSLIIDNYVYTVSYTSIHKFDMNNDFEDILQQQINQSYYDLYGYPELTDTAESVVD